MAVTIGSNLGRAPNVDNPQPGTTSTLVGLTAGDGGYLASPVNGMVTTWRIRAGAQSCCGTTFRVIRPFGVGAFTGAGTSAPEDPPPNSVSTYPTALPISIGDRIGIDCCTAIGTYFVQGNGTTDQWSPALPNNVPGRTPGRVVQVETAINADIEPTSAFKIRRIRRSSGGGIGLKLDLPNPGKVFVDGPGMIDRSVAVKKAGLEKVSLRPTRSVRSRLARRGTAIKTSFKVSFTPTFGSTAVTAKTVRLKP